MEFDFNISSLFDSEIIKFNFHCLGGDDGKLNRRSLSPNQRDVIERISVVINRMGEASAKAQGLHHTITTYNKLLECDQTLYLVKDDINNKCVVVGILKVGRKKLFLQDSEEKLHEMDPLCVLDFYIHENYQRKGCGLKLFEYMLKDQNSMVYELAIDRPSEKLQLFMKKHYKHLGEPVHQRNNFTIYNQIFSMTSPTTEFKCTDISRRRLRYSDQTATNNSNSHWSRSLQRHSYPKYDDLNSSSCSSVGAVVFGQRLSQGFDPKVENSTARILQQRNDESGLNYSDKCCQAVDSSMNVFGVPSPPNRYRLT
ncbi:Alpha-tubulin N-acetyltransferase 1 [Chamberlinius hualienensis]